MFGILIAQIYGSGCNPNTRAERQRRNDRKRRNMINENHGTRENDLTSLPDSSGEMTYY